MSHEYMINIRPVIHIHRLGSTDRSFGIMDWNLVLEPHDELYDFETDGLVAEEGHRCVAFVEAKGDVCAKAGIVVLAVTTSIRGHYGWFHLCGSHLARHRAGREVRLAV